MPATHLVTRDGRMLEILAEGCEPGMYSTMDCFVPDGVLGTLGTDERFVATTQEGDGSHVLGLVDSNDRWYGDPVCESGCTIQRADSVSRMAVSGRSLMLPMPKVATFRHDPIGAAVILGYYREGMYRDGFHDYEVRLLSYE